MTAGQIGRLKRQLLREAVAENVETMLGLPPRPLRPVRRTGNALLRRAPLALIPLLLGGFIYVGANGTRAASTAPLVSKASAMPAIGVAHRPAAGTSTGAATAPDNEPVQPVSASAFPLSVRRVVLDAGHGGTDPGASSTSNVTEKEITLDIEKRLGALLRRGGFDVVVTRDDDRLIALRERARRANGSGADIFVSIHVNSIPHPNNHGVETYYLGATNDPSLTQLAAAENLTSGYSLADMRGLLDRVYGDVRRDESRRLATSVQQQLYGGLRGVDPGLENWGVKRAPFIVLVATEMPAILAEVGCLSNDAEARMLKSGAYREQIAQALFHGIHAYAAETETPQKKGS